MRVEPLVVPRPAATIVFAADATTSPASTKPAYRPGSKAGEIFFNDAAKARSWFTSTRTNCVSLITRHPMLEAVTSRPRRTASGGRGGTVAGRHREAIRIFWRTRCRATLRCLRRCREPVLHRLVLNVVDAFQHVDQRQSAFHGGWTFDRIESGVTCRRINDTPQPFRVPRWE